MPYKKSWGFEERGRMEGGVQLQKILSLFISVISRLWWFSSTKLQQHRKHEHKSAQITDCLSLYGRTERIKSINEKIIHEPKKKNPKLRTWWRWDWCSGGGQWTLLLLSSTFVHTENCSVTGWSKPPLIFVLDLCSYTYIYIYIEVSYRFLPRWPAIIHIFLEDLHVFAIFFTHKLSRLGGFWRMEAAWSGRRWLSGDPASEIKHRHGFSVEDLPHPASFSA